MNTCADVRPLIDLSPLGLLDDEERATLHAHLPACATCRAESTALAAAHAAERRALEVEAEPLSPSLRVGLVQECDRALIAAPAADSAVSLAVVDLPKLEAPKVEAPKVEAPRPVIPILGPTPVVFAPLDLPRRTFRPGRRERRRAPWIVGGVAALALAGAGVAAFDWRQRELREGHLRDELRRFEHVVADHLGAADRELTRGRLSLEAGDLPDALEAAQHALAALDELPRQLDVPDAHRRLGEMDEAGRRRRAAAIVLRAEATMLRDELDSLTRSADDLRTVLEQLRPGDPDALRALGELNRHSGRLDGALENFGDVLEVAPNDIEALLGRARVLSLLESFTDVLPITTTALERLDANPGPAGDRQRGDLLVLRARAFEALGEPVKALQDARAAVALRRAPLAARTCLGDLLMRSGDHFAARDVFAEAIAVAGAEGGAVLAARASALLEAGFRAEALEDARAAVERDPASIFALVVKAEAEEALLHLADAVRDAEVATLRAPPRAWVLSARAERVLARVRATTGNVKAAHEHAKRANAHDDGSTVGRLLLATIELDPVFEDQHIDDAENLFKQVLRQRTRSPEARRGLGLVALAKHARTPERAQRKLEEAYEEDTRDPWTMAALALVFEDRSINDKARALRARAARFERDPRRPAGHYYLLGVREERRAREVTGVEYSQHLELARDAYRRALFFDPLHSQALAGLASITYLQGARAPTEAHLKRALAVHPGSTQLLVLGALHTSSRDVRERDWARAVADVSAALAKRGETLELLGLRALLTVRERLSPGETLSTKVKLALERFGELRRRDPWNLEHGRLERELIAAAKLALDGDDELRDTLEARDDELRQLLAMRGEELDAREKAAQELRDDATKLLNSGDAKGAVDAAQRATRLAPWRADGWALLGQARGRLGDVFGALAAGVRAAHVDDRHAVALFALLRAASRADGDLAGIVERSVSLDRDALPFEPDLERLLRAAPLVARALVARPEVEVGKKTAEQLLELANHDPTRVTPQLLVGVLAFGADQDELAIQSLLAVATLRQDAGEAYFLAALVAASQRGAKQADLVQAAEWIEDATFAGFDWKAVAGGTPRLDALRQSPLWSRVEQGR